VPALFRAAWACDPTAALSIGLPVFMLVAVFDLIFTPKKTWEKIIDIILVPLLIALMATPLQILLYIWVIYQVTALCTEFITRSEKSWKDFYLNHKRRVWVAGSLLLGGLAAKILFYAKMGFAHFWLVYRTNFTFFKSYLALSLIMLGGFLLAALLQRLWLKRKLGKVQNEKIS